MSDESHRIRWGVIGMSAGIVVFLAGVVLLILVFVWTFNLFHGARAALTDASAGSSSVTLQVAVMGFRVALLFVMGYVASLIGSKGLQLYGVCRGVSPR